MNENLNKGRQYKRIVTQNSCKVLYKEKNVATFAPILPGIITGYKRSQGKFIGKDYIHLKGDIIK